MSAPFDRLSRPSTAAEREAAARQLWHERTMQREPTAGRVKALNGFMEALTVLGCRFQDGDEQEKRSAIAGQMMALLEYLSGQGAPRVATVPIARILSAMVETERGNRDPLFEPIRSSGGGRPPTLHCRQIWRGTLAGAASLWIQANAGLGQGQDVLLNQAAAQLSGEWQGQITLQHLRAALATAREEAADHPTRSQHDMLLRWPAEFNVPPREVFLSLVALLRNPQRTHWLGSPENT
jgi:hypothetical protein